VLDADDGSITLPLAQMAAAAEWVLRLDLAVVSLCDQPLLRHVPESCVSMFRQCFRICDALISFKASAKVGPESATAASMGLSDDSAVDLGWRLSLLLPRLILTRTLRDSGTSSKHANSPRVKATVRRVKWRCNRFLRGDWSALFTGVRSIRVGDSSNRNDASDDKRQRTATKLARNGELRRAVAALDALPPLPHDGAVFDAMNAKFPADVDEPDLPALLVDLPESRAFTDDQWIDLLGTFDPENDGNHLRALQHHIISKLPRESGVGPSSFSFEMITALADVDVDLVWRHILRIIRGRVPVSLRPYFAAARLVALRKKEGRDDPRPISIGEIWRRLAGKVAVFCVRGKAAARLKSIGQFGVGVRGGCDAVVHSVRLAMHQLSPLGTGENAQEPVIIGEPEEHHFNLTIPTDVENAFGEVLRAPIFRIVRDEFPELFEMVRLLYGQDTYLYFRLDKPATAPALSADADGALYDLLSRYRWIRCVRGVHQGCPFGSLLFCLALVSVVEAVLRQFPSVRIPSIADDMTLVGPQLDCAAAFIELKRRLWEDLRLKVSPGKCKAFSCGGHTHPEVRSLLEGAGLSVEGGSFPSGGFILAGVPVGATPCRTANVPNVYEEEQVVSIVQRRAHTSDRLIEMTDPHAKYLITRYCVSARYNHLVRGVDPVSVLRGAEMHDEQIARLLRSCLGISSSQERWDDLCNHQFCWRQALLPERFGGVGAVPAMRSRWGAYYGSWALVAELVVGLFTSVGPADTSLRSSNISFSAMTMPEDAEDVFLEGLGGEGAVVPQSFISVHGTYGAYFTELQSELSKVEEAADLPPFLQKNMPLPLLFVELSRRQVNSAARDYAVVAKCQT
jgi:hypothetical protein